MRKALHVVPMFREINRWEFALPLSSTGVAEVIRAGGRECASVEESPVRAAAIMSPGSPRNMKER